MNTLISPTKYIATATISTTNNAMSFSLIPAYAHSPDPIKPNQRLRGYMFRLVSAIPIKHSVVPVHFIFYFQ